jgi:hypothetical protein
MPTSAGTIALDFVRALADATPALFALFSKVGGRDKFLAVLDATLTVERAKTDADLDKKHHAT